MTQQTVEQQVVTVTNTIVQIQPANPQVIYVPQYNPAVVYAPPPAYVYNPVAPLVTFGVGMAVGAAIANNCDWHGGGVYVGHHGVAVWGGGGHGDVDVDVNRNVNVNNTRNTSASRQVNQQKWQPDPNRVRTSGASGTSAAASSREARGWSSGSAQPSTANRPARPAGSQVAASRPQGGTPTRPATTTTPRPTTAAPSRQSAFSGVSSGASARTYSSRGAASRGGGGFARAGGGRR